MVKQHFNPHLVLNAHRYEIKSCFNSKYMDVYSSQCVDHDSAQVVCPHIEQLHNIWPHDIFQ